MNVFKPLFAFLFFGFAASAVAQVTEQQRCSTTEYMELQKQRNPELITGLKKAETELQQWIAKHGKAGNRGIITIPVVVHLVYNPDLNMQLSDWQVKSQIDVLNEDYRRQNADRNKTPGDFGGVASDTEIEFCLAKRDPNGNPTTGILREPKPGVTSFNMGSFDQHKTTAWPRDQYLNIWVAKLANSVLGYTTFPGVTDFTDGAVVTDTAFGRIGELKEKYNRGRTATHEVGHWLNLVHIWGDDSGCNGSDYCDDTPNQADFNTGSPAHPHVTCSNSGDMFMNYLDYVHDSAMNVFTADQKARMIGTMNVQRQAMLTSAGCNSPVSYDYDLEVTSIIHPAMNVDQRYIEPQVRVTNNGIHSITGFTMYYQFHEQDLHSYTYNTTLPAGTSEVITLPQIKDSIGYNFFIAYAKNVSGANGLVAETDTVNNFSSRSFFVSDAANEQPNGMEVWQNEPGSNPFLLSFDLLVYKGFELTAFNVLGQRVDLGLRDGSKNQLEVELRNVTPGVYFVRAVNGGKKLTKPVIILSP